TVEAEQRMLLAQDVELEIAVRRAVHPHERMVERVGAAAHELGHRGGARTRDAAGLCEAPDLSVLALKRRADRVRLELVRERRAPVARGDIHLSIGQAHEHPAVVETRDERRLTL